MFQQTFLLPVQGSRRSLGVLLSLSCQVGVLALLVLAQLFYKQPLPVAEL